MIRQEIRKNLPVHGGRRMFRAEIHHFANGPVLKMEGRLVGDWAEQALSLVARGSVPKGLIVDLTEVTYVDSVGEQVLNWLNGVGAVFVARNVYAAGVCETLNLQLRERVSSYPGEPNGRGDYTVSAGRKQVS
jgi:anti-anti-sigma regulatory factor